MSTQQLVIKAKCRDGDPCLFEERNMFLDIKITNAQGPEVEFPLEYVQKAGPIVKLINTSDKRETHLKRNLADPALLAKLTPIRPGSSVNVEWVITRDELRRFGEEHVDVSAEITIMTVIRVGGNSADFRGVDTIRIVSRDKP